MTIKELKQQLKEWKQHEVKERFESVNSTLHLTKITEIKCQINQLKTKK